MARFERLETVSEEPDAPPISLALSTERASSVMTFIPEEEVGWTNSWPEDAQNSSGSILAARVDECFMHGPKIPELSDEPWPVEGDPATERSGHEDSSSDAAETSHDEPNRRAIRIKLPRVASNHHDSPNQRPFGKTSLRPRASRLKPTPPITSAGIDIGVQVVLPAIEAEAQSNSTAFRRTYPQRERLRGRLEPGTFRASPWEDRADERYPAHPPAAYSEFDKHFQPDNYGEEATDNARVWKVYRTRVTDLDNDLIEGWKDTLNFLLVFAGLFSAVATAFIIQYSQRLQPDYSEITAKAILAVLSKLDSTYTPPSSLTITSLTPTEPSLRSRWINGVWFLSLSLALVISLLSILVKQWLVEYVAKLRAPVEHARRWAWRHYVYRTGLDKWGVGPIISGLTVLLHAALFLFLVGLLGFLSELDAGIFWMIFSVTAIAAAFYGAATLLPLWFADCPSTTPLLANLWSLIASSLKLIGQDSNKRHSGADENSLLAGHSPRRNAEVISWMIMNLPSNGTDSNAAIDAIGALDPIEHHRYFRIVGPAENPLATRQIFNAAQRRLLSSMTPGRQGEVALSSQRACALRALLFMRAPINQEIVESARILRTGKTHDAHILASVLFDRWEWNSASGLTNGLLHINVLDRLSEWWASQTSSPRQMPMTQATRQHLLYDMLIVVSAGTGADLAPLIQTSSGSATLSRLSAMILLSNGDLSVFTWASALADLSHLAIQKMVDSQSGDLILTTWRQHPHQSPPHLRIISAWSFALEFSDSLGIGSDQKILLLATLSCALPRAPMPTSSLRWTLPEIEATLGFLAEAGVKIPETWKEGLLVQAASVLERYLITTRDEPTNWSRRLGDILFGLLQQFNSIDNPEFDIFRVIAHVLGRLHQSSLHQHTFRLFSQHASHQPSARELIESSQFNFLLPRVDLNGNPSSAWRLAIGLCGAHVGSLAATAAHFAIRLSLLTHPALGSVLGADQRLSRLMNELAGGDRGVLFAMHDHHMFFELACHGKIISPTWWSNIRARLLEIATNDWYPAGTGTHQPIYQTAQELVELVDSAQRCHLCTEDAAQLVRILKKRRRRAR